MKTTTDQQACHPGKNFSLAEKILIRSGFSAFVITGGVAIYLKSMTWGFIYTGYAVLGLTFVVFRALCTHCPYPYKHSDCLFIPHRWIRKCVKQRPAPLSLWDKIGFIVVIAGLVAIPQYWLVSHPVLLLIFELTCLPVIVVFPFYYCRRCLHAGCPFNCAEKNPVQGRVDAGQIADP